MNIRATNT